MAPEGGGRRVSSRLLWGAAVALALVAGIVGGWLLTGTDAPRSRGSKGNVDRVTRQPLAWPQRMQADRNQVRQFGALSPDGTTFVYAGGNHLRVWRLDELDSVPLRGTENGFNPFFSPNGQSVAFFTTRELNRASISGGIAETICEVDVGLIGAWGPDDTIVYGSDGPTGLWQVSATGGVPKPFSTLEPGDDDHDYPHFLPDGSAVLYTVAPPSGVWEDSKTVVQWRTSGERKTLVENAFYSRFTPTGHLVFARRGGLFAVRLDSDALTVGGDPRLVLEDVMQAAFFTGIAAYSFANDGTLLYVRAGPESQRLTPVWVDRNGDETSTLLEPARYALPALSSDGRRLAAEVRDLEDAGLWIFDLESGNRSRVNFERAANLSSSWSSDGRTLFYSSNTELGRVVYSKRADGSGAVQQIAEGKHIHPRSASPDGSTVLGHLRGQETGYDVVAIDLDGEGTVRTILGDGINEIFPQFSPDGRWLAYTTDETERPEVYVSSFPELDGKWQVSEGGGWRPLWRRDGRELLYRNLDGAVVSVNIDTTSGFEHGSPTILFEGPYSSTDYAVAPDGMRFLLFKVSQDPADRGQLVLVRNWFDELERLVPTD